MNIKNIVLSSGLEVSVECPTATGEKGMSVIRGWRKNKYLLMDVPKFKHAFPVNNYNQATWLIRYVHEGEVVGFRVKGKTSIPDCDLFALEYPEKIETHLLRKQSRAFLNMPVRLHTSQDPETSYNYKGMTVDISVGGVRIKLPESIKKSNSYFVSIYLPIGGTLNYIACKIIKSSFGKRGCELGMSFINISEKHKKAINDCLHQFCNDLDPGDDLFLEESK